MRHQAVCKHRQLASQCIHHNIFHSGQKGYCQNLFTLAIGYNRYLHLACAFIRRDVCASKIGDACIQVSKVTADAIALPKLLRSVLVHSSDLVVVLLVSVSSAEKIPDLSY